jgi:uncharacterized membrane protein
MTIPYWHPLTVHFPIALLLVGGAGALVWGLTGRAFARRFALVLLALGTVGVVVARQTGEVLEAAVEGDPAAERFLETHEAFANYTLAVAALALGAALSAEVFVRRRGRREPLALRLLGAGLGVAAAILVARTGHLGGLMVWGVGDGTAGAAVEDAAPPPVSTGVDAPGD